MYFGSAWGKIMRGPAEIWLSGEDLQRSILLFHGGEYTPIAEAVVQSPLMAWGGHVGTAVLQLTFIAAIILGLGITIHALGLIGFHIMVVLTMGLYFIDMIFLLCLFLAFDRAYGWLVTDRYVDLVYDEHCYFCARSLYLFKLLDINNTVTWYSQYDAPDEYSERESVEFEDEMYVFVDGEAYGGYYAFHQLLKQFWITVPLAWLMALSPVATVGERVYQYIAANRDRHFVCSYDPSN